MWLEATCIRDHKCSFFLSTELTAGQSQCNVAQPIINSIYFSKLCQDTKDWKPSGRAFFFFFSTGVIYLPKFFARILQRMLVKYITVSELHIMLKTQLPHREFLVYYQKRQEWKLYRKNHPISTTGVYLILFICMDRTTPIQTVNAQSILFSCSL